MSSLSIFILSVSITFVILQVIIYFHLPLIHTKILNIDDNYFQKRQKNIASYDHYFFQVHKLLHCALVSQIFNGTIMIQVK